MYHVEHLSGIWIHASAFNVKLSILESQSEAWIQRLMPARISLRNIFIACLALMLCEEVSNLYLKPLHIIDTLGMVHNTIQLLKKIEDTTIEIIRNLRWYRV